ncbi:hypothetical protein H4S08_001404 [Coemansia sp. RSA 1365]|nr:hypothetical protein H4S08_001404 [Coemansia sp. RSA 1365]
MANLAATFTSGLVFGSGAICAFTTYVSAQSRLADYRLKRASVELERVVTKGNQPLPTWKDTEPSAIKACRHFAARLSSNAIPLAKAKWNATIYSTAESLTKIDLDTVLRK